MGEDKADENTGASGQGDVIEDAARELVKALRDGGLRNKLGFKVTQATRNLEKSLGADWSV